MFGFFTRKKKKGSVDLKDQFKQLDSLQKELLKSADNQLRELRKGKEK